MKLYHIARIITALLLLMTLKEKFGGETLFAGTQLSQDLFTKLGSESWSKMLSFGGEPSGRIISGFIELIIGTLLLIPRTAWLGALATLGTMVVAIILHIGVLGYDATFILALIVSSGAVFVAWKNITIYKVILSKFKK